MTDGVKFGKYELLERLARGGMAEIFLARAASLEGFEKLLVIKRIRPTKASDPQFIRMFLDEARVAASLDHPNVVQIYDVGAVDGEYFLAMEYLHGTDLQQLVAACMQKGMAKPPLEATLTITSCALAGLHYAHNKRAFDGKRLNIVHRDVTPQNIVVTYEGSVKVVDFGIAAARIVEDESIEGLRGKAPYMSPEQAKGETLNGRSDVFSVGILLYELTVGRRLYKAKSEAESRRMIIEDPVPDPAAVDADYPPELREIVMKALAKSVDERYGSAREMQEAIDAYCRTAQLRVGYTALGEVMEKVFDDRIQAWREAEQEGKTLLDHIRETAGTAGYAGEAMAVGRDVSWFGEARRKGRLKRVLGAIAALAVVGVVGLLIWQRTQMADSGSGSGAASTSAPAPTGTLQIASVPSGARVVINGKDSGRTTPCRIDKLALGEAINVRLELAGHRAAERTLTPTRKTPGLMVSLALVALAPDTGVGDASPEAAPQDAGVDTTTRRRRRRRRRPKGYGYLSIATRPWAELMIDNRPYGQTPQVRLKLRAGRHSLRLFNARFGIDKRMSIYIRRDQVLKKRMNLK
ncbi:MAG: serine/threonine protein kinase [Myxococcales bacterium]|nr:serine/threonine protein kinase [Myxococcales bacterium]